jgi:hypothetical protein
MRKEHLLAEFPIDYPCGCHIRKDISFHRNMTVCEIHLCVAHSQDGKIRKKLEEIELSIIKDNDSKWVSEISETRR